MLLTRALHDEVLDSFEPSGQYHHNCNRLHEMLRMRDCPSYCPVQPSQVEILDQRTMVVDKKMADLIAARCMAMFANAGSPTRCQLRL
jgi:hypothetical protein